MDSLEQENDLTPDLCRLGASVTQGGIRISTMLCLRPRAPTAFIETNGTTL